MQIDFSKLEKKILKFWEKNEIFEKSVKQRARARNFVFYDGPATANARPDINNVLARIFKDIICRYKTMRGFKVIRRAGWDTHGLPVELEVEKKLGLKNKKDIERYGIAKFNEQCKKSVWEYKKDWEKLTRRIGFWLDMRSPYITYEREYMETLWWIIKQAHQKGLLCQDYKPVPYCPRCGTSLSSHEAAQGCKKVKEPAIFVKFRIKNPKFENSYLLAWTANPWTLPGNVAIAVNENFVYCKVKSQKSKVKTTSQNSEVESEYLIVAKERAGVLGSDYELIEEIKGKDLIGLRYEAPYPVEKEVAKNAYKIIPADFISLTEGTGIIHIAPAFGENDMELIKEQNEKCRNKNEPEWPILLTVDESGKFVLEVEKWAGIFFKDADPLIIEDLKTREFLFKEETYERDCPFCWRCGTPLLYYARKSWFFKMSSLRKKLLLSNYDINWVPDHLKKGRFGKWLKDAKDWTLSRERYWGTPLPIWQCQSCLHGEVIGSVDDLLSQKFSNSNYFIFRHGHSLRQVKKITSCWPEKPLFPLTEKGKKEVRRSAKRLKKERVDLIISSDLLRTKETAEIIAEEIGAKVIFDKRLREFNVGIFNNKNPKLVWDYLAKKDYSLTARVPKGESFMNVKKRMFDFITVIDKKYQGKNIVIVSHELPLTILEKTLKGKSLRAILNWRRDNKEKIIKTGSFHEIDFRSLPFGKEMELDLHRPYIDRIKFYCPECNGKMERIAEVADCWFDSGSMPFAQAHFPFACAKSQISKLKTQNYKNLIKKIIFPADYICEGVDQTRGWFYALLAVSSLLGFGPPYKNVISLGRVLDGKGEEMSKLKNNTVDPRPVIEKYGADAVRWYFYTISHSGDSKIFIEKDVEAVSKKTIMTLWNSYTFFDKYVIHSKKPIGGHYLQKASKHILDKWILSKLNKLVLETTEHLDGYNIDAGARVIEKFIIDDLSLWYIGCSKKRLQNPENENDSREFSQTLGFVLFSLTKIIAPFLPFLSEEMYRGIVRLPFFSQNIESVHLDGWPKAKKRLINKLLEEKMDNARAIVTLALRERSRLKITDSPSLKRLIVRDNKLENESALLDLIKEETNVKEIVFESSLGAEIMLDSRITPERGA